MALPYLAKQWLCFLFFSIGGACPLHPWANEEKESKANAKEISKANAIANA